MKKRLLLVGGGHAHLFVAEALAKRKHDDIDVVLISPQPLQYYSGMLPGWVAGYYALNHCCIDLRPLLKSAGIAYVQDSVIGIDVDKRCVCLSDGRHVHYDMLSLNVGSETQVNWLAELGSKLLPIKPLSVFSQSWPETLAMAANTPSFHLAVVGGGAAGVEVALCVARALRRKNGKAQITLVAGEQGLLPGHPAAAAGLAEQLLMQSDVRLEFARAVGTHDGLLLSNGTSLQVDKAIATTGARPPVWLQTSKLQLSQQGFIEVNGHHQSESHANVFAAGDVCARSDLAVAKSGVHAVKAGPVLAHNLLAFSRGDSMRTYRPKNRSLYLLADGSQNAILSWGPLAWRGHWIWRWKDAIDRRFVSRFSLGEDPPSVVSKEQRS